MNLIQSSPYILIIALLLGLIVYLIKSVVAQSAQRCETLTQALADSRQEQDRLRSELEALLERKRQTGPTMAGLEDMAAALARLKLNRETEDVMIQACLNTAQKLRQGPYAYDPDTPSGERKEFQ